MIHRFVQLFTTFLYQCKIVLSSECASKAHASVSFFCFYEFYNSHEAVFQDTVIKSNRENSMSLAIAQLPLLIDRIV